MSDNYRVATLVVHSLGIAVFVFGDSKSNTTIVHSIK
jgi:hypothetical protein